MLYASEIDVGAAVPKPYIVECDTPESRVLIALVNCRSAPTRSRVYQGVLHEFLYIFQLSAILN